MMIMNKNEEDEEKGKTLGGECAILHTIDIQNSIG